MSHEVVHLANRLLQSVLSLSDTSRTASPDDISSPYRNTQVSLAQPCHSSIIKFKDHPSTSEASRPVGIVSGTSADGRKANIHTSLLAPFSKSQHFGLRLWRSDFLRIDLIKMATYRAARVWFHLRRPFRYDPAIVTSRRAHASDSHTQLSSEPDRLSIAPAAACLQPLLYLCPSIHLVIIAPLAPAHSHPCLTTPLRLPHPAMIHAADQEHGCNSFQ